MIGDRAVHEYLDDYAATLTAFDATAAAELWAIPGMIVDDRASGVLTSRDEMAEGLARSYPLYRDLGLADVVWDLLGIQMITDALALVQVRWIFLDAAGVPLTDSTAHYLLRDEADGHLRATVCIQVDDAEKLRALADERGIDLPTG